MTELHVPNSPEEPDELARLRAENERLRAMVPRQESPVAAPRRRRRVGRWTAATVFLLLGCLLLPVSAIALFARRVVFNTDRYVETVAPLARDPAIQDAVADRITAEVFAALDIDGFTGRAIDALVDEVQNGTVSVNLGAFIQTIKPQLVSAGVPFADRIPAVNLSFPVLRSDELPRIQRAAGLLDTLAIPLVLLAFLVLAIAVWLAPNRRRMLAVAGLGMALALLALLGVLAMGRGYYLTHLPPDTLPADAVLGLVIALCAWVVGSGQLARALRSGADRLVTAARTGAQRVGWQPGAADRWVDAHVAALRAAAVVLVIAVYALWTRPSGAVVIWLALLLLLLLLVAAIELLRKGVDLPAAPEPSHPLGEDPVTA